MNTRIALIAVAALAATQAAAGPNRKEQTTGTALAGRNSVIPGISGTILKGIRIAA